MQKILLIILCFFCFTHFTVQAQYHYFQNYTVEKGLPQSQVSSIFQDQRGNLWIGTNGGGLCRFTGSKFDVYTRKDGLLSDLILDIKEDKNGNLVILSILGLSVFDGQSFENHTSNDIQFISARRLYQDKAGNFWFRANSSQNNPEVFLFDGYNFKNFSDQYDQLKNFSNLNTIVVNEEGNILISAGNEIFEYRDNELRHHILSDDPLLKDRQIIYFHLDQKNFLWFFSLKDENELQIYRYKEQLTKVSFPKKMDVSQLNVFYEDGDGNFWLANPQIGELYEWVGGPGSDEVNIFTDQSGFEAAGIRSIGHDYEGNIWIGTDGNGIFKYGGTKFISFQSNLGLDDYFIWSFYQDTKGNMWFGTANEGLLTWKATTLIHYPPDENTFLGIIRAIFEHKGKLMIGSNTGIWKFDGKNYTNQNSAFGLPGGIGISDVFVDDDQIWIGTYTNGLYHIIDGEPINYNQENAKLNHNQVDNIIKTKDGLIWIASRGGLTRYDGREFKTFQHSDHLGFTALMQLTEDKFGNIWAATYGSGVYRIYIDDDENVEVKKMDTDDGLSSNNVYSILTDREGNIWAGCQNGADKITLDNDGNPLNIRNYDNYEGFTGYENNAKANYVDKEGKLWFGTIHGAMVYNSEMDKINTIPPKTSITNLQLFYKDVDWKDDSYQKYFSRLVPWIDLPQNLVLPYNRNHLTFEFEGLSYTVPEKVSYQWKLEGVDNDWSPPTSRSYAVYTNLNPGSYTFSVRASNNDGIWNEYPSTFTFDIKPPFWGTWWFRSIVFSFIIAFIIIISWLRNKFIQEKREELEQLVAFKTKKLEQQKAEILQINDELKSQYSNLEMLSIIGRDITANLTVESLLDSIYKKLNTLMDAPVLGFGILNLEKQTLDFPYLLKNGENVDIKSIPYNENQSLALQSLKDNKEIIFNNIRTEEEGKYQGQFLPGVADDSLSVVILPLIYNDKPLGVFTVQSFKKNAYNEYHLNILRNLANYAKIALENANAYEKIQEQKEKLTKANVSISIQKAEIEDSNKKLQELNQEKNNIISIVAHDLKNPLTSALTMANILKDEGVNLDADQKHCIHIIEKSVNRMNNMISRLLDIKKIEDKIVELKLEKVNLEQVIQDVNRNLLNEINRKKIKLLIEAEELYAQVDPDYAIQVFENLLSNAIKFSPPEKNITVKLLKNDGKARTEIIDEGPGLTEEDKKKIFGKFQRLSAQPTAGEQSTGLGLSIVKKYVEAMKGEVWCESEYGNGANFIVEFRRIE